MVAQNCLELLLHTILTEVENERKRIAQRHLQ